MLNQAFFKRIIPFLLTFILGLFVASFFVSIMPSFKFRKNKCGKRHEFHRLYHENQRLEREKQRLQQKLDETERMILLEAPVPPPPPMPPAVIMPMESVPAAPAAPRAK
jgi:hypothetical protein